MNKKILLSYASDTGYGDTKAFIDGTYLKHHSVVSEVTRRGNDPLNSENEADIKSGVSSILDNLDVEIDGVRYYIGNHSWNSSLDSRGFDLSSPNGKKSSDNLTVLLNLGFIAGRAVQESYEQDDDIFKPINVDVVMTTALPIKEIQSGPENLREVYKNKYLNTKHQVVVKTFDKDITVNIDFKIVKVYKEGEIALLMGLPFAPDELKEAIKGQIKAQAPEIEDEDIELLLEQPTHALGIDIGYGTIDLSLTNGNKADPYLSESIHEGYGNILQNAMQELQKDDFTFKDLTSFEHELHSRAFTTKKKEKLAKMKTAVAASTAEPIERVRQSVADLFKNNNQIEMIYLFGGGSISLKENSNLQSVLEKLIDQFDLDTFIVWIPNEYAQNMNVISLRNAADALTTAYSKKKIS